MKKVIYSSLLLLFLICVTSCNSNPLIGSKTIVENNIEITLKRGKGTVSGVVDRNKPSWECIIPESINGVRVTGIGYYAFSDCHGLTSVTIPDSISSIGYSAFEGCFRLTSVMIPDSVTTIEDMAFSGCSGLTSVTIGDSVTTIGGSAFSGCFRLTSVAIGDSVTSIGDGAFSGCSKLTSVAIGNSVTTIGDMAFYGCSSLTSVEIPNSVTAIGDSAFFGCRGLVEIHAESFTKDEWRRICGRSTSNDATVNLKDGARDGRIEEGGITYLVKDDGTRYVCDADKSITTAVIPSEVEGDSVTSIRGSAFEGCTGLTSVTIPDSVTSIGEWAFSGCSGLTSVTIGGSVTTIGDVAFSGCPKLAEIRIDRPKGSISGAPWGASNATVKWRGEF